MRWMYVSPRVSRLKSLIRVPCSCRTLDACSLWKVPVLPVKPWQITLVCLKTAGDVDEAWTAFRKQLELGREIEVVDENGDRIEYGDYPDEEDPEYD